MRRTGFKRERNARAQTAAAARDKNVGLPDTCFRSLFRDLEAAGALAGDHVLVVKGLDE